MWIAALIRVAPRRDTAALRRYSEDLAKSAATPWGNDDRATLAHALNPAEIEASLGQRGTNAAAEVWASFCPVKTRTAENAAVAARCCKIDAEFAKEHDTTVGHLAAVIGKSNIPALAECVAEPNAEPAGEMVVAGPRRSHCIVQLRSRPITRRRVGDNCHDAFQHLGDPRCRDAGIAVATLLDTGDESTLGELAEMSTRRLRRHARGMHELARSECATAQ